MNNVNPIFGPDITGVMGETGRHKPDTVVMDYVAVPCDFLALHKYVTLVADVCFSKNVASLITMSRGIKILIFGFIRTRIDKQLSKILKRIMKLYTRGYMKFQTILMDM